KGLDLSDDDDFEDEALAAARTGASPGGAHRAAPTAASPAKSPASKAPPAATPTKAKASHADPMASSPQPAASGKSAAGSPSSNTIDWDRVRSKLPPLEKTPEAQRVRLDLFRRFDPNGNGYLSLAE